MSTPRKTTTRVRKTTAVTKTAKTTKTATKRVTRKKPAKNEATFMNADSLSKQTRVTAAVQTVLKAYPANVRSSFNTVVTSLAYTLDRATPVTAEALAATVGTGTVEQIRAKVEDAKKENILFFTRRNAEALSKK